MPDKSANPGAAKRPGPAKPSVVKLATKKRYDWPPPPDPDEVYVPRDRNPIHSILTALPILMLVVGLYFHFKGESEQSNSAPIRALSVEATGVFTGLSEVNAGITAGSKGRQYLWFDVEGRSRGVRVQPSQVAALQQLKRGEQIVVKMAPSVEGSTTLWAWYVEQSGTVALDAQSTLQ